MSSNILLYVAKDMFRQTTADQMPSQIQQMVNIPFRPPDIIYRYG